MIKLQRAQRLLPFIGILIAIYLGVILAQTVKHNYDLNKQISSLQQRIDKLSVEREELEYKIQYFQTDAYKEKEARAKLGLQAPGENVIYLPKQQAPSDTEAAKTAKPKPNWQQWIDFLFG